ncbi:TonB-dependent receptor [Robertkochia solimangrovi]|uniref:TonB-dependent receptor n=1 Tax=Robertkochia solimangrovi TaxID=2213046 RepID=UPI00117C4A90|nr:TonB-dependent receptor [Robertkochia solimangrovi]TRZ43316.1 TonB-dependent receptor [Robertkochia solimangrovi]
MKSICLMLAVLFSAFVFAQQPTGSIVGKITDKEMNNDPLPFANVQIKGSTKGTTTDMDGLYEIAAVEPGTYTIVVSFIGYETLEIPNVTVEAGKVTELNTGLGAGSVSLDEVVVTTTVRRDSETALLLDQKKAVEIKESIGAQQLAKIGVSDVATATTKISGVSSSEGSGDVFVRGLGDRYLSTTLNGLPIPSDDVERKNIDLGLFPTRIIQNVSISKTYAVNNTADQSSGNIDISSRELVGDSEFSISVRGGANTNVMKDGISDNFKVSPNQDDVTLGFYKRSNSTYQSLVNQSWNTQTQDMPYNYRIAATAGKKIGEKLKIFLTGSQSVSHEYRTGVFRQFRSNFIEDSLTDVENYKRNVTTTGLLDATYAFDYKNKIKFNTLMINKLTDEVFEGGRNGEGTFFEETDRNEDLSQFVRDQNMKQTKLYITQLSGTHKIGEFNDLDWAAGYNVVDADEPNRIRNEVNFNEDIVQLGRTGGFQQRKSAQSIFDEEINGFVKDKFTIKDEENTQMSVTAGGNFRNKTRDFESQFYGVEERTTNLIHPSSIDDLGSIFTQENFDNGTLLHNNLTPDVYNGELNSYGGFATFNVGVNKWNVNLGLRYQNDDINVDYNVGNIPGRIGSSSKSYSNVYPSLNVKYTINEKNALRFASSKTITLPEFKEIAPFEYVSQTGQVTRGNPDLEASTNYNFDLKWEFFPSSSQLISLATFYKLIEDPINKVQDRGAAGVFSYFNSGDQAEVYGLELESRLDLLKSAEENNGFDLALNMNATRMWHSQDLREEYDANGNFIRTFRYKGRTENGLQGASDWIFNGSLNFTAKSENPLNASLTANYASDKIYALGAPEIQTQSETMYNDDIVEKGFVTLDAVISKEFANHWNIQLRGLNLLNPEVRRTQFVKPSTTGIETEETVRSYSTGSVFTLGVSYNF